MVDWEGDKRVRCHYDLRPPWAEADTHRRWLPVCHEWSEGPAGRGNVRSSALDIDHVAVAGFTHGSSRRRVESRSKERWRGSIERGVKWRRWCARSPHAGASPPSLDGWEQSSGAVGCKKRWTRSRLAPATGGGSSCMSIVERCGKSCGPASRPPPSGASGKIRSEGRVKSKRGDNYHQGGGVCSFQCLWKQSLPVLRIADGPMHSNSSADAI
ncbi:hypothetical protein C8J57DRAFT_461288 [Mycena rebaudengoi]|nr:hypothetical protein C8J57DRAFT_461288 [Mycena rebaudengoi]